MHRTTTLVAALLLAGCGGAPESPTDATSAEIAQAKLIPVTSASSEAIAAFERGRSLVEHFRQADAVKKLDEALTLDPEFAQAHAWRGMLREGPDGLTQMRKAAALAAATPEPERLAIEAMLAEREGDAALAKERWTAVAALAPDDWRAHFSVARLAFDGYDWKASKEALVSTTKLNPQAGPAWNLLGYANANLGDYDAAVAAFEKYAEIEPSEANPHDSMGEVLLMAGRYDEAERAFTRATEVSPDFWVGHSGVAQSRFLRGDWEGGRTALGTAIGAATRPEDRVMARQHLAWSWIAAGDPAQAAIVLGEAETEALDAKLTVTHAWIPLERASMALYSSRWSDAAAHGREALARAEAGKLEGADLLVLRLYANVGQAVALSMKGDTADAEALLASIEGDATRLTGQTSALHRARGAVALGKGDTAAAIAELSKCEPRDATSLWLLAAAYQKAGDTPAAEATRERILGLNHRYGQYLGVWAQVGGPAALAAATTAAE